MYFWEGFLYDDMTCFGFGVETLQERNRPCFDMSAESTAEIWYFCPYLPYEFISRQVIWSVTR